MNHDITATIESADEYLTFALGEEEYGVEILKVQEIRGYDTVTRLPDAPDYIKGVINLRGTIVPVIDMRLKFRLAKAEYNALTVMIVLNVADRVVGMVVDSVSDVIRLEAEQIRPVPEIGATRPPVHHRHRHAGRAHADPAGDRAPDDQRRDGPGGARQRGLIFPPLPLAGERQATRNTQHATRNTQHATRNTQHANN